MSGTRRFLERTWRVFEASIESRDIEDTGETDRLLHQTIKKVTEDIEKLRLNTAVSQLMIFINHAIAQNGLSLDSMSRFVRLLAPFAPHVSEEMWQALGNNELVLNAPWPKYDPEKCLEEEVTIVVQVNGKLRSRIVCTIDPDEASVKEAALSDPLIGTRIAGKEIVNVLYVPNRILNIIVK